MTGRARSSRAASRVLGLLLVCAALGIGAVAALSTDGSTARGATRTTTNGRAVYAKLGTAFEVNRGQAPRSIAYLARGPAYWLGLGTGAARLALSSPVGRRVQTSVLALRTPGGHLGVPSAADALAGRVNYLIGRDRSTWLRDIATYGSVSYRDVWPGVGLAFRGRGGALEFDFDLAPGANANAIALRFAGARALRSTPGGGVTLTAAPGSLRILAPVAYQAGAHGARVGVASRLVVRGTTLRVALGRYDHRRAVVIDPSLLYSTYLGGSAIDSGNKLAVDSAGDVYVTGDTTSPNFPVSNGAAQPAFGGGTASGSGDGFVTKLNAQGALVYSTYLGGSGDDDASGIAVDSSGQAYVTGETTSTDFPTHDAYQATYGGSGDAFVTELDADGTGLVYSTYLGGAGADGAYGGIALDAAGDAYVAGSAGQGLPGAAPATFGGEFDAFVTELAPGGARLIYSTYLGGTDEDRAFALTVDPSGAAYIAGDTGSTNFPVTAGAYGSSGGAFVAKLAPGGSLGYSTYFDGNPQAVAVDSSGEAYVTGTATSSSFPTTSGAFQTTFASGTGQGTGDGFVTKFNPAGTGLVYSTFLGGTNGGSAAGIALDPAGDAYLTGNATAGLPTTPGAYQLTGTGAFVTELNPQGTGELYSSYLGGTSGTNFGDAITIDPSGDADVAGAAGSDFPTTADAAQTTFGGGSLDAFVMKLVPLPILQFTLSVASTGAGSGSVSSSPAGINCGSACSAAYPNGTPVTLTATPASGSVLTGWSDPACPGAGACTETLTADTTVTATFAPAPPAPTLPGGVHPPGLRAPANTSPPVVSGTALPGHTVSCSTGAWSANPIRFAYQWRRDGAAITGATRARYAVQLADAAQTLTCAVTASNAAGAGTAKTSAGVLVAVKGTLSCPRPSGRLNGAAIGPLALGTTRARARRILRRYTASGSQFDDFCLYAGFGIRVGYPSPQLLGALRPSQRARLRGSIVLALTANPYYALDGARPGEALNRVVRRVKLGKTLRIGVDDWYVAPGKGASGVVKVRGGIIQEVGLASQQLTLGRNAQSRLLHSFRTG